MRLAPLSVTIAFGFALILPAVAQAEVFQVGIANSGDESIVAVHAVDFEGEGYADLLDGAEIDPGEVASLTFDVDSDDCEGDLIVDFADGSQDTAEDINLCDDDDYSFSN